MPNSGGAPPLGGRRCHRIGEINPRKVKAGAGQRERSTGCCVPGLDHESAVARWVVLIREEVVIRQVRAPRQEPGLLEQKHTVCPGFTGNREAISAGRSIGDRERTSRFQHGAI